jgi:hypothetical protein
MLRKTYLLLWRILKAKMMNDRQPGSREDCAKARSPHHAGDIKQKDK